MSSKDKSCSCTMSASSHNQSVLHSVPTLWVKSVIIRIIIIALSHGGSRPIREVQ